MIRIQSVDRAAARRDLRSFLEHGATGGYPHESVVQALNEWLDASTDEEVREFSRALEIVREGHTSTDPSVTREAKVITDIFHENFDIRDHLSKVHGMLSVRSAFCSEWAIANKSNTIFLRPLYLGFLGDEYGSPFVPDYRDLSMEQIAAALRYAYEMTFQAPSRMPVREIYVERQTPQGDIRLPLLVYKDPKMVELIAENADRVDKLIKMARSYETNDVDRLAALLEYDGPSSLGSGYL